MKTHSQVVDDSSKGPLNDPHLPGTGVDLIALALTTCPYMLPHLCDLSADQLSIRLLDMSIKCYGVPAKPLHLETTVNLLRLCNVSVLAATGFKKTQMAAL